MRIHVKRCRTCGALGVGPKAVKLYPLDDQLYCGPDFKTALDWTTNRSAVVQGIEGMVTLDKAARVPVETRLKKLVKPKPGWRPLIEEWSGMAAEALVHRDKRTFVYYFSRAMWAWDLANQER